MPPVGFRTNGLHSPQIQIQHPHHSSNGHLSECSI
jgi:hypothetical protein